MKQHIPTPPATSRRQLRCATWDEVYIHTLAMATSNCRVVNGAEIAKPLLEEVKAGIKELQHPPRLHGFLANTDPAARMYADWTGKTCKAK